MYILYHNITKTIELKIYRIFKQILSTRHKFTFRTSYYIIDISTNLYILYV